MSKEKTVNSNEWFYKRLAEKTAEINHLRALVEDQNKDVHLIREIEDILRRTREGCVDAPDKKPEAPHIVADGTPYVPFMSEQKCSLVRQGKWEEAAKLPNYMRDSEGRLYVEVLTPDG